MANFYGDDVDNFSNAGGFTDYYGGGGHDILGSSAIANAIYGGEGNDVLYGATLFSLGTGMGTVVGDPLRNPVPAAGASGDDYLEGGRGRDGAWGFDGNDTILGGDGDDGGTSVQGYQNLFFTIGLFGGGGGASMDSGCWSAMQATKASVTGWPCT